MRKIHWGLAALLAASATAWAVWPAPCGACSCLDPCQEEEQAISGSTVVVRQLNGDQGEMPEIPDVVRVIADVYGAPREVILGDTTLVVLP